MEKSLAGRRLDAREMAPLWFLRNSKHLARRNNNDLRRTPPWWRPLRDCGWLSLSSSLSSSLPSSLPSFLADVATSLGWLLDWVGYRFTCVDVLARWHAPTLPFQVLQVATRPVCWVFGSARLATNDANDSGQILICLAFFKVSNGLKHRNE